MRLRQPHLPRQAGELDRGLRARARAAVVPGDQDHVRLGLRHAGRDRAHPRLADQLHADLGARVDLLEVVDQLRQILDRVDVVVRRRRDQRHAGRRVPQLRDQLRHLDPRQLPALAGLRTLGDLDLQLLAVVEIVRRHPEPPARHLLDLGARVVAVALRRVVRRVLAPLAGIALRADPVHRHVQRLVRLGAQRAQAHPRRHEPLADRGDALDLVERHRSRHRLEIEQIAQMDRRARLHRLGILLPDIVRPPVTGRLQDMHRPRLPGVTLARAPRLVEAADRQHRVAAAEPEVVHLLDVPLHAGDADAGDPRQHPREILRHHRPAEAHRLEVQAAAIAGDHRDPHLGDDLEQTLVDCRSIARHRVAQAALDQPAGDAVGDRILCEIGVHRRRARPDQHREIVRIDAFARPHVKRGEGPQALAGQPRMHRARGEDHRHRHPLGTLRPCRSG